jgi:hypothetical protein
MLRDSPCGGTSKAATLAVSAHVSLRMKRKNYIFSHTRVVTVTVAAFDAPPQGLSRNVKYCSTLVHFMLTAKIVCFFV